jgi:hypothetical protein
VGKRLRRVSTRLQSEAGFILAGSDSHKQDILLDSRQQVLFPEGDNTFSAPAAVRLRPLLFS